MEIKQVTVIGAGVMGRQIAMNAAQHGYIAVVNDSLSAALDAAGEWKTTYLQGRVAKGKLSAEDAKGISGRYILEADLAAAVKDADLVVEAIIEKEDIKKELFTRLDQLAKPEAILASNSSFIPSSVVAHCTKRPEKVCNLHYFNPATVMELVEVVQGEHTAEDTIQALMDFAVKCGKRPIWIKKEIDGFVANRLLRALTAEAVFLVDNGYASVEDVDCAAEKGLNFPMGPFRLMDLTGIDLFYLARERRYAATGDEKDKAPRFIEEKYLKKEYGRKTGKGWYDYSK